MSLAHRTSRDDEERREHGEPSRCFTTKEIAERRERVGLSRPSWLRDHQCACVGTCHRLPSSGCCTSHNDYPDAHSMKRDHEMDEATSAPAWTSGQATPLTWQEDTCQDRHTFHYHNHYYHHGWPIDERGPIRSGHAFAAARVYCCCAAANHDFSSHEGPPINCPVNISDPLRASSAPATRRQFCKLSSVSPRQSKRFLKREAQAEVDPPEQTVCAAVEASPLTLLEAALPPLINHCIRALPPFPSTHAPPFVLCQHCSRLLLLPPGALLLPPPGTLLLDSFLYVKLKCGFCLNISKFSTRHLHRASSFSPAEGIFSPLPRPLPFQSMPSCIASNEVMHEAAKHVLSETELPINGKFEPALEFNGVNSKDIVNGNAKQNLEHEHLDTGAPLNGFCKNHFNISDPSNGNLAQSKVVGTVVFANGDRLHTDTRVIEIGGSVNGTCGNLAQSKHVETGDILDCECAHTQEIVHEIVELNGTCGDLTQSLHVETGALLNCECGEEIGIKTVENIDGTCRVEAESQHPETGALADGTCGQTSKDDDNKAGLDSIGVNTSHQKEIKMAVHDNGWLHYDNQTMHNSHSDKEQEIETGAPLNGECAHTEEIGIQTVDKIDATCRVEAEPQHPETGGICGQTSKDEDNEAVLDSVGVNTSHQKEMKMTVHDNECLHDNQEMHNSHSDKEQKIIAHSSVQDWVDSLSLEIGYESDSQFHTPLNCLSNFADGTDKFVSGASSQRRSALHRHLGYSSPSELFEKILFSEDEEIKARTETSLTASSSFSSNNACQPSGTKRSGTKRSCIHMHARSLRSWDAHADHSGVIGSNGQDVQKSLAGLLRKGLKVGSLLPASPKTRVVVNGHTLSSTVVKQAEERAGKLRPGSYWYDCKAGFWGVEGGPCLGILPPYIEELNYPMTKECSNGDTQVYVNGRELHAKDLAVLSRRGLTQKAGRAYSLGFDGVLVDETTGLELKHLGKLAPTVEQRGKGFGMFTADASQQSKKLVVHHIKLAN